MGHWPFRLACVAVLCSLAVSAGPAEPRQYLTYPLLRGQHAAYLVSRLSHFRDRPAVTSNDFIMSGVVATLDDGSIQSLAAWLESLAP
jgi:cytochrome c553